MPGALPSFLKCTGTSTVMINGRSIRRKSNAEAVGHRIDLHVARQDIEALAVDLDLNW